MMRYSGAGMFATLALLVAASAAVAGPTYKCPETGHNCYGYTIISDVKTVDKIPVIGSVRRYVARDYDHNDKFRSTYDNFNFTYPRTGTQEAARIKAGKWCRGYVAGDAAYYVNTPHRCRCREAAAAQGGTTETGARGTQPGKPKEPTPPTGGPGTQPSKSRPVTPPTQDSPRPARRRSAEALRQQLQNSELVARELGKMWAEELERARRQVEAHEQAVGAFVAGSQEQQEALASLERSRREVAVLERSITALSDTVRGMRREARIAASTLDTGQARLLEDWKTLASRQPHVPLAQGADLLAPGEAGSRVPRIAGLRQQGVPELAPESVSAIEQIQLTRGQRIDRATDGGLGSIREQFSQLAGGNRALQELGQENVHALKVVGREDPATEALRGGGMVRRLQEGFERVKSRAEATWDRSPLKADIQKLGAGLNHAKDLWSFYQGDPPQRALNKMSDDELLHYQAFVMYKAALGGPAATIKQFGKSFNTAIGWFRYHHRKLEEQ